jgi:hypothetical protein
MGCDWGKWVEKNGYGWVTRIVANDELDDECISDGLNLVATRHHTLVEDSADEHAVLYWYVKDDVLPLFDSSIAGVNRIATPAQTRIKRDAIETYK